MQWSGINAETLSAENPSVEDIIAAGGYEINAGDILSLAVWNEPSLGSEQILVRPDGFISVPVVGEIMAGGRTVNAVQIAVAEGLNRYLKDEPNVVISILNASGSRVYVLGKVQRPGAFPLSGPMDVTQALAMAGGLNSFAAENSIKVLRRNAEGVQRSMRFKYGKVKDGERLESNILLHSGDVVLVP
ncbi:polysaccharide export protein [Pseudomonadales bacterium]|nr:polysaccharide export protein [Pseudomonadales bacterium]